MNVFVNVMDATYLDIRSAHGTCLACRLEVKNKYCNENNDLPKNPWMSEAYQQGGMSYVP